MEIYRHSLLSERFYTVSGELSSMEIIVQEVEDVYKAAVSGELSSMEMPSSHCV